MSHFGLRVSARLVSRFAQHGAAAIALCAGIGLLGGTARADILVVAADGSGDFTSVNSAAMAAASGDTLLVRPGLYGSFAVGLNKSVTVVNDGTGQVLINGPVVVLNTAPGTTVVLSGLTAAGIAGTGGPLQGYGIAAVNNAGTVRVQDCSFTGADGDPDGWIAGSSSFEIIGNVAGWHGALLRDNSGTITFNDCSFAGGSAPLMTTFPSPDCGCTDGEPGGDAVHVDDSTVALANCSGIAGHGATADRLGGAGGAGVRVLSGEAFVSGCDFTGGHGGGAWDYIGTVYGGDGGHGVHAGATASASLLDNVLDGGLGGGSLTGNDGAPGADLGGAGANDAQVFAGTARRLGVSSPAFVGQGVTITVDGTPGDLVMLLLSTGNGWLPSANFQGVVSIGLPALSFPVSVLPPSGQLQLATTVPAIGPLVAANVYLQAIVGTASDAALTGEAVMLLIDPAGL